jgi:hypothetical protein
VGVQLQKDRLYYPKALNALDRLTGLDDIALRISSRDLHAEWRAATNRSVVTRAYRLATEEGVTTDVELAFAWLYQDVAHGDHSTTGRLGVQERFRAAAGFFSGLAILALATHNFIGQLVELGTIQLPAETFSDPVIVTETEFVWECEVYESEVGADLGDVESGGPVPDHFRPLFDSVKELREERERPL